jgi:TPR repeat protein
MAHVGMCLLEGTGVEKDSRAGVDWLRRAARRNDVEALNALGVLWAEGAPAECNMSPNDKKAAKYYKRAAELGHVDGATNLAMAHLVRLQSPVQWMCPTLSCLFALHWERVICIVAVISTSFMTFCKLYE